MADIPDVETLYRRVLPERRQVTRDPDGRLRVSSSAFDDREMKPSVDRESHCTGGPAWTQQVTDNGVLSLNTGAVRAIDTVVQRDAKGRLVEQHKIDVEPAPLPDNPAHCQIVASPEYRSDSAFRKLRERLALMALPVILPRDVRDNGHAS